MVRKFANYKEYVKKLQTKLELLGFKYKDKNNNMAPKMSFIKIKNYIIIFNYLIW